MAHAILGPSSADRWMTCLGSVALSMGLPDRPSDAADEGTCYHFLASHCLQSNENADEHVGRALGIWDDEARFAHDGVKGATYITTVDADNAGYVQRYIDYVRLLAFENTLHVEQSVPIGHLTEEEGGEGTADAIVINELQRELAIVDLKFGRGVAVEAEDNHQMRMYALGALEKFAPAVDTVRMVIVQPRSGDGKPQEWVIPVAELNEFATKIKRAAKSVWAALNLHNELMDARVDPRSELYQSWADQYLLVTEKACRWCRAKSRCPKIAAVVAEVTTAGMEDETQTELPVVINELPGMHPNQDLANKMLKVELIEGWLKAVRAEVERELLAGREVPHYKLVQGKKGNRQWTSDEEAAALLKKMRLRVEEMYDLSIKSPPNIEKQLKATPKRWQRILPLITQRDGKISVAHESDGRAAVNVAPDTSGMAAEENWV